MGIYGVYQDIMKEAIEILKNQDIDEDDMIEKDFVFFSDMKNRAERFGENFHVSPAQVKWLRDIKERYTSK